MQSNEEMLKTIQKAMADPDIAAAFQRNFYFIFQLMLSKDALSPLWGNATDYTMSNMIFALGYILGKEDRVELDSSVWGRAFDE